MALTASPALLFLWDCISCFCGCGLGGGLLKRLQNDLISQATEKMKAAFLLQYTPYHWNMTPKPFAKHLKSYSCFGFGTGFPGEGSVRGEKLIECGWNASDPRLCPRAFSGGAPRRRGSWGLVGVLTFCLFTRQLNPGWTQVLPSRRLREWLAVLFSLVFYIGSGGGRFRSLALTK